MHQKSNQTSDLNLIAFSSDYFLIFLQIQKHAGFSG